MQHPATSAAKSAARIYNRGLLADAAALGVHRTTLWRAINAKGSQQLLNRYKDLLRLRSTKPNKTS